MDRATLDKGSELRIIDARRKEFGENELVEPPILSYCRVCLVSNLAEEFRIIPDYAWQAGGCSLTN